VNLKINEPEGSTRGERTPRPAAEPAEQPKKSIDDVIGNL
jgi:hypothetical protein